MRELDKQALDRYITGNYGEDFFKQEKRTMNKNKIYIGDGIYMEDIGYAFLLTTEDGISVQNTVHIEQHEWDAMVRFVNLKRGPQEIEHET